MSIALLRWIIVSNADGNENLQSLYPKSDGTAVGNLANTNNISLFPAQLNKLLFLFWKHSFPKKEKGIDFPESNVNSLTNVSTRVSNRSCTQACTGYTS